MKHCGGQSSRFDGIVADIQRCRPPVWKIIDPDSEIMAAIKRVSPNTVTIARIYTGQPEIDDEAQHPDPYAYGVKYAERVFSALKDPQHTDYLEWENEPVDHYGDLTKFISRLNLGLMGFANRAVQLGFKPLGPNFSVGYPEVYVKGTDYKLWPNAWNGLSDGLRAIKNAGGAMGLHEYAWPDILNGWSDTQRMGYTTGRCFAIYKCLPTDLQDLPLYLTEYGIDALLVGQQGGFWHNRDENAPYWLVDQLKQGWERIYSKMPQFKGACFYLHGNNNPKLWEEYDTCRTDTSRQVFVDFMATELAVGVQPPVTEPPITGEIMPTNKQMLNAVWNTIGKGLDFAGVSYNPDAAFVSKAINLKLGPPTGNESRIEINGVKYAFQMFRDAFLWCKEGDWGNIVAYDPLTAEVYAPQVQPPVIVPPTGQIPYSFPSVLTQIGAYGEEGKPTAGQKFYRLTGATVRQGISAFMVITVLGKNAPAIGAKVVNLFPDGNGEVIQADGSGVVRFQFAASSAFTQPGTGPFTVFVADETAFKDFDSVPKRVVYQFKLSDIVHSLGDFQGQHTEIYLQFQEMTA